MTHETDMSIFRQIKEIMAAPAYVEPWPEPLTDHEIEQLRHQPQLNRGMSLPAMESEDFSTQDETNNNLN